MIQFLKDKKGLFMSDGMNVAVGVLIGLLIGVGICVGLEFAGMPIKELIMGIF